jgi:hypothetical protein
MARLCRTAVIFALMLTWAWLPNTALAQRRRPQGPALPQPYLQSVFPLGVKAGGSVEITIRGNDLEGATTLWFDHPGLKATHVKDLRFKVEAAEGTPVGHHDVRAVGTYGLSNPRAFVVGDRDEMNEAEPNNTPELAKPIRINSVVNGELAAADVDCFAVEGKKGQRLLVEVEAERVDSRLDATLRLLDASGRELAESRDAIGADPLVDVTLPSDGRYVVKLHDVIYRGSNDHTYRLTVTDGPHIDAIVPVLARPEKSSKYTLFGRNLGGDPVTELSVDGRPLERKTVTIESPAACDLDPAYPSRLFVASQGAERRGFEYVLRSSTGSSNPIFLALTNDPIVEEREPNDAEHPQEVSLPCDISGAFGAAGDLDVFEFRAKKSDVWMIEAGAERIGSPADPVVVVQKVPDKGAVEDLETGEDLADRGGQTRFNTSTGDVALRWSVPQDGLYRVAIRDVYGSHRGDARLAYRLNIRPERPDFSLFVLPESPNQPDALTLAAGGRAVAYVMALRSDGFRGPIRVEALDLPAGVRCEPVLIGAGESQAPIVFEAAEDAKATLGCVRLVGRARFGDRKESLEYVVGATALGPELSHAAVGGAIVWPQAQAQQGGPPIPLARVTRGFVIKVIDPAPLTLTASPASKVVTPGSMIMFELSVKRRAGFLEAVTVTPLKGFPGDQTAYTAMIPKTGDTAEFTMTARKDLAPGVYSIVLQGAGTYPFSKDPKAKNKPNVNLSEPSNPITIYVRPAPGTLVLKAAGPQVKAGGQVEVVVTVTRKDGASDPVPVALAAPKALKLSAEPIAVTPGKPAKLVIRAATDSPVDLNLGVAVRATVPVRGEAVDVLEPLPLKIAK